MNCGGFVVRNAGKISILAWVASVLFVFSCGNEAQKERLMVEREIELRKEDSIRWVDSVFESASRKGLSVHDSSFVRKVGKQYSEHRITDSLVKNHGFIASEYHWTKDPNFEADIQKVMKRIEKEREE